MVKQIVVGFSPYRSFVSFYGLCWRLYLCVLLFFFFILAVSLTSLSYMSSGPHQWRVCPPCWTLMAVGQGIGLSVKTSVTYGLRATAHLSRFDPFNTWAKLQWLIDGLLSYADWGFSLQVLSVCQGAFDPAMERLLPILTQLSLNLVLFTHSFLMNKWKEWQVCTRPGIFCLVVFIGRPPKHPSTLFSVWILYEVCHRLECTQ